MENVNVTSGSVIYDSDEAHNKGNGLPKIKDVMN